MSDAPVLPISLVIVSDFEPGPKTWQDEDECLRRSMADPQGVPAQVVIAAASADADAKRPDWSDLGVPIEVVFVDSTYSGTIKNAATAHVTEELVAVVEADCVAEPGWLQALYRTYLEDTTRDAVTGLTSYAPTSAMRRVTGLYDRGYLTQTFANGDAAHISNNGALYKKSVLKAFPYDDDPSPFVSGHKRHNAMRAAGIRVGLARDAFQYHAYGGWPFIVDVRMNKGHQHEIMEEGRSAPAASKRGDARWAANTVWAGLSADYRLLRRAFGTFCRPLDLPLALIFPLLVRGLELRGARAARRGLSAVPGTSYR
ncbi:MAG: glycosyltransferase family A protein [Pseudomonadota bacterium]